MKSEIIYIRVFATVLVVFGHCWLFNGFSGFTDSDIPGGMSGPILGFLCSEVYTFHMALFFAVSGFLSCLSSRKETYTRKNFIESKCRRILLPFIVVSLFFCLPIKYSVGTFKGIPFLEVLFQQVICAKDAHTWFLLALLWNMVLSVLLITFTRNNTKKIILFLAISIGLSVCVIPPEYDILCIGKGIQYSPYFIWGYLLSADDKITESVLNKMGRGKICGLFIVFIFFQIMYMFMNKLIPDSGLQVYTHRLIKLFIGVSAFILFWGVFSKLNPNDIGIHPIIQYLDKKSFEIYLYSEPINYIILAVCRDNGGWTLDSSLLFVIRFILTFCTALGLSHIVKINFGQK